MTHRIIAAATAVLVLTACASTPGGADRAASVSQMHPIGVDQQAVAVRVPIDATRDGLDRASLARIDALVSDYRSRGHGPITVTAPVGASDRASQTTAAAVRAALHASGVPYEAMTGASLRTANQDEIIVSFQAYVATAPVCGRAPGSALVQLRNQRSPDFGCAAQANLAAMISDPRDLHAGAVADGAGDDLLAGAVAANREAEVEVSDFEVEAGE